MEIFFTKNKEELDQWDAYVSVENKASHLLLSDWNQSFTSYGFDFEVCLLKDQNEIVGGFVGVIAKALFFKFYIVPYGPIVSKGYEDQLNHLIAQVPERAKQSGSCYCHISLPSTKEMNKHTFTNLPDLPILKTAKAGQLFKYVYSGYGLNWIDLVGYDEESKIITLKPSVRRNIRNSYRKDLIFKIMTLDNDIEQAYHLFKENSIAANYSIRDWKDMRETLLSLNKKGFLKILAAFKDEELKGAILLIKGGNYYTYILGGSKKEVPDLRTGDFLQWEAIKLSLHEGLDGYNISLGGSPGVVEFKNSFNTVQFYFENAQFHWVIKPIYFKLYLFLEKHLKNHKKTIARILSLLKK
ncbi:lipid II:glycine glycyltransferase FemX [Flavobacterium sp.]|uniref:lipid II:glycine glycyltransferase FemX n=1 Tax=Flavobacterium sp. TaxID=239 RepID=UPI00391C7840